MAILQGWKPECSLISWYMVVQILHNRSRLLRYMWLTLTHRLIQFFLNRHLVFVEGKYVLSQFGCLILAPTSVCLATKLQIQARNRQKSDGHVFHESPGNGPTHIGARVEFLALRKCSAKSSSLTSLFLYKWTSPVQWAELSPETNEEDVSPRNLSYSQGWMWPISLDMPTWTTISRMVENRILM